MPCSGEGEAEGLLGNNAARAVVNVFETKPVSQAICGAGVAHLENGGRRQCFRDDVASQSAASFCLFVIICKYNKVVRPPCSNTPRGLEVPKWLGRPSLLWMWA